MKRIIFFICIFIIAIELGGLSMRATGVFKKKSLPAYAAEVIARCSNAGFAPSCYDIEIPKLMSHISMEEAFDVTRLVQQKDSRYLYCHVLGHNLSYRETGKDLTKWKDVVARCPTTFCNNGCQHGAIIRRFNAESLTDAQIEQIKPDLTDVCEPRGTWNPTEVERSMCYHALGHLHMFITKADIPKSVDLCTLIGTKKDGRSYVQTCTQGVLMSVYQPLEPEDFALVKGLTPTKEGVSTFCDQFTGTTWLACHSESWPLFATEIREPSGLMKFCAYTDNPADEENCISTAISILTVEMVVNRENRLDTLHAYCNGLPLLQKGQCYASASFRLVQIDPRYVDTAIAVCTDATGQQVGETCFRSLLTHVAHSFHAGSPEAKAFCGHFPSAWKPECLKLDR